MAKFGRFLDAEVVVNSVDLSSFVRSVQISESAEVLETQGMGDTTRVKSQGYLDWTIDIEWYQSYYTAEVNATLDPLYRNGTQFVTTVMPNKTAGISPTNPKYTGTGILSSFEPLGGAHGEILMSNTTIESAGALARSTA